MEKDTQLIKAEARVAKWELALEQCRNHDLSKKSYLTKKAKSMWESERDGDFTEYAISKAEKFASWIENWELKYARSNLKERQGIWERKQAKANKANAEQARIDALPECVKKFLKEVELKSIEAILRAEEIKEKKTKNIYESYKTKGEKLPWNFRFFHARTPEEVTKDVQKSVRYLALDFINRVEEKCGDITDTSLLRLAPSVNGTVINGFVKGNKGSAEVETIWAGGYNIQCLHCRVLVK